MPLRIPVYTQQTTIGMAGAPRASAVPQIDGTGAVLASFGAELGGMAREQGREQARKLEIEQRRQEEEAKRQQLEDAKVWTAEAMSGLRIEADRLFREGQSTAEMGAPNFTQNVTTAFDDYADKVKKNAPAIAQDALRISIANIRDNVFVQSRSFEERARSDWRVRQVGTAIDNTARLVQSDPSQFGQVWAEQSAVIQALDVSPAIRDNVAETARKKIINATVAGFIMQNPDMASVAINDFMSSAEGDRSGFRVAMNGKKAAQIPFGQLTADEQMQWQAYAKTLSGQQNAVAKQRVNGLLRDAEAAALDGKPMVIPEEAFAAFGPEAPAAMAQYQNSQQLAADIAKVSALPMDQRAALVNQRLPAEGGPGYAEAAQRNNSLSRAVAEVNKRQADDPAAFTINTAPQTTGAAFQRFQQSLQGGDANQRRLAAQEFAVATVAEQTRLGVQSPQILPKPLADQIARRFMTPAEGGQGPAQLIQAQSDMWGPYWPSVYRQIAKDIGPTARVVSNLRDTPAAAMLSMNAGMKTPDLRKAVLVADAKTVDDTIDVELEPFRQSLVGWTTAGSSTYNDFDEAARRNAYVYAAQGTKPGDAAKRAVRDVVGDYYEFRGTTRFPKLPSLDPNVAERGMGVVLRDAEKLPIRAMVDSALGQEFTEKQIAASVKNNGFFVTLGDDSGVALYLNGANGQRAVEGKDGRPITFTWQQLMERGVEKPKAGTAAPAPFGSNPGGAATGRAQSKYGQRVDGTEKGSGFFGELKRPDGGISTELSANADDVIGGKPFPLIVPTLTRSEIDALLNLKDGERAPDAIFRKAVAHAEKRVRDGKSPFAGPGEQVRRP